MPGCGWAYAHNQTEAGEVKGGAAAAAAKVENTRYLSAVTLISICVVPLI